MLKIVVTGMELFDQRTQEFIKIGPQKPVTLHLEHSLISLSKWEERTKRKFFDKKEAPKTKEDFRTYIQCMSLDGEIKADVIACITDEQLIQIIKYIEEIRSATTVNDRSKKKSTEILTSELIYYYMSAFHLPFSAEKWHLSRLLKLIEVANAKSAPGKKMKKQDILKSNSDLNRARRAAMHSKG